MMSNKPEDGMLCDRCGNVATHFHEDYGNLCPDCARFKSEQADRERREEIEFEFYRPMRETNPDY